MRERDMKTGWFDFHCHLTDITDIAHLDWEAEIGEAEQQGVVHFFSNALSHSQMLWHQKHPRQNVSWYAGIHPMFVPETQQDLPMVAEMAHSGRLHLLGEIGLDSRCHEEALQKKVLLEQLEVARDCNLPVVFHCVGRFYDLFTLIRANFPGTRGILHSFASSPEVFHQFRALGFAFSLGGSILTSRHRQEVVKAAVTWGHILMETDAPAQRPHFATTEFNHLHYLPRIGEELASMAGLTPEKLQSMTWNTLDHLGITLS